MSRLRRIKEVIHAQETVDGAGVRLHRVIGFHQAGRLDPFLLLDEIRSTDPEDFIRGFPWHPHRGIETVSYIMEGEFQHGDSMGNSGHIGPGDIQWMTAGSGIVHQEMPRAFGDKGVWGYQLWVNLPSTHKMIAPRYQDLSADTVPVVRPGPGIAIRVLAGTVEGIEGPVKNIVADPEYLDVTLDPSSSFEHRVPSDHTLFAHVMAGSIHVEGEGDGTGDAAGDGHGSSPSVEAGSLALLGEGDGIRITPGENGARFMLVSGLPINEPIAWRGPIVMNTQEELDEAFREYSAGTFIK